MQSGTISFEASFDGFVMFPGMPQIIILLCRLVRDVDIYHRPQILNVILVIEQFQIIVIVTALFANIITQLSVSKLIQKLQGLADIIFEMKQFLETKLLHNSYRFIYFKVFYGIYCFIKYLNDTLTRQVMIMRSSFSMGVSLD